MRYLLVLCLFCGCCPGKKAELESKIVVEKYMYSSGARGIIVSKDRYYIDYIGWREFVKIEIGKNYSGEWVAP